MLRTIIIMLSFLPTLAFAKSSRTVRLSDGEMGTIYVESGYSTLLKFTSRPEPGLIGDQDGFKVEYLKNIASIKPLTARGKTNLFVFTKDGQFNFELVAGKQHDNLVFVEAKPGTSTTPSSPVRLSVAIDALMKRSVNKRASVQGVSLRLESLSQPKSRSTLILRFSVAREGAAALPIEAHWFSLMQGKKTIPIENLFLERCGNNLQDALGYILIRTKGLSTQPMKLIFKPEVKQGTPAKPLELTFFPSLRG